MDNIYNPTVTDWIKHLTTDTRGDEIGTQISGAVYPGVGTEGVLVVIALVIWVGWHLITVEQEEKEHKKLAKRRPSSSAWKSNVTDG